MRRLRWAWLFAQTAEADFELSLRLGRQWKQSGGFCVTWMVKRCQRLACLQLPCN